MTNSKNYQVHSRTEIYFQIHSTKLSEIYFYPLCIYVTTVQEKTKLVNVRKE